MHINRVRYVYNHEVIYSAAENIEELVYNLRHLRDGNHGLAKLLEAKGSKSNFEKAHKVAVGVCHYGELPLLHQRWLAIDLASAGFLNAKEAISHAAHEFHRDTAYYDLRTLHESVNEMLAVHDRFLTDRSGYLVYDIHDLPKPLQKDFREARDLFSLGFDEMGLFACGRGLEMVARAILGERSVKIMSKGRETKASEADLYSVIECMDHLRWVDGSRFVGKKTSQLLHWVRMVRNEAAHPSDSDMEARQIAPLVAKAAMSLWIEHSSHKDRALQEKPGVVAPT